ncbi:hypothetical protein ARMGADRAFT_615591 [Armillaria gallica]|uniref:Uncharacterized protein n=1 Tax=Armillaria gallica TaxID=47427 RepID=A0A2H3CLT7_ARMGA|nr:hypothetical protein ARMGADRAFT_615591 [Armillaria gallica]
MNASEMRECSKRSRALDLVFPSHVCIMNMSSWHHHSEDRVGRTGRHTGDLEEGIILPAAHAVLCPVARHPLYQEQDRYGGDVFGTGRRGSCLLA